VDPEATLYWAGEALADGEMEQARGLLQSYREWRAKGGWLSPSLEEKASHIALALKNMEASRG
jgi:hypothetical protein